MTTKNNLPPSDSIEANNAAGAGCMARLVRLAWMRGGSTVQFHGWRDVVRCAVGDGSHLYTDKQAIIETEDGSVTYCEATDLQFADRGHPMRSETPKGDFGDDLIF
jgi:hypothetical protein